MICNNYWLGEDTVKVSSQSSPLTLNNNYVMTTSNPDSPYRLAHYRDMKHHREWNRICPDCGKPEFSPYINIHTQQPVDDKRCGMCGRLSNCGYHLPPRKWAEDYATEQKTDSLSWELRKQRRQEAEKAMRLFAQKEAERIANSFNPISDTQPPKVQAYLDRMEELCRLMHVHNNTLADYLYSTFPKERVDEVLNRYHVGSTLKREVIYWQIDRRGRVRAGKIMSYGNDGHRVKSKNATWTHSKDGIEQLAPQCLFGEHLLDDAKLTSGTTCEACKVYQTCQPYTPPKRNNKRGAKKKQTRSIALVESEKSVLFLSIKYPNILWLATGGKQNFKHEMLWTLYGYDVIILPDADAIDEWTRKMEMMNSEHDQHFTIPKWYREMCTPEARAKKWDLVDMILKKE